MAVLLVGLLLSGCRKDESTPAPASTMATVKLRVNFMLNGVPYDPTTMTVTDSSGVRMRVDRLRFFLAQPSFTDDNGDTVARYPVRYLLPSLASNGQLWTIGEADAHLHDLHFLVGLDSVTNHADPLQWTAADAPLNDATMHWGWNPAQGYQFLQVEGKYDLNGNGTVEATDGSFYYHCGGDALLTERTVQVHTDADAGGIVVITLECAMDQLFREMDVMQDPVAEIPGPVTRQAITNLANALTHP